MPSNLNRTESDVLRYFELLSNLTQSVYKMYPGFRMRVYHNITGSKAKTLCGLYCQNKHIDFCNVTNHKLKDVINTNKSFRNGMFWRFLPLGDPTVKNFFSRDLDAYILDREVPLFWLYLCKSSFAELTDL